MLVQSLTKNTALNKIPSINNVKAWKKQCQKRSNQKDERGNLIRDYRKNVDPASLRNCHTRPEYK